MPRKFLLTATMPDGTVKTIGPTATPFTHYWRIVAVLHNGKTEVFWGHTKSLADANRKRAATRDAAQQRGWQRFEFEVDTTKANEAWEKEVAENLARRKEAGV